MNHIISSILLLYLFTFTYANAQSLSIRGEVFDRSTRELLPFVSIGLASGKYGTISNADGSFVLTLNNPSANDTVLFSTLGYDKLEIPLSALEPARTNEIKLSNKPVILKELTVSSSRIVTNRKSTYGNSDGRTGFIYGDSLNAGAMMALLITPKQGPLTILKARLKIQHNALDSIRVRLRLYQVDKASGKPGDDILNQNIMITTTRKSGWIEFDLTKYNILIGGDFFLAFEWIMDAEARARERDNFNRYKKNNPGKAVSVIVQRDGEDVNLIRWDGYRGGVAFTASMNENSKKEFKCFYRNFSLGAWYPCDGILTAELVALAARY